MRLTALFTAISLVMSATLGVLLCAPQATGAVSLTAPPTQIRTNSNIKEGLAMAASDSGRIYVSWSERISDDTNVYLSYSSNNGSTFSPAARVNSAVAGSQKVGGIDVSGNSLFIAWEDSSADTGNIMLSRSGDGGLTFNETHVSSVEEGSQTNPSLAVAGNAVAVTWEDYRSDNSVRIWRATDGALTRTLSGHSAAVRSAEFSPSGVYLASGSEDATVKVWNAGTGALVRNLTAFASKVTSVGWSAGGGMLAAGCFDHNVTIFDTSDYSVITRLNSVGGVPTLNFPNALSFSPDSARIAVAYNGLYDNANMPTGYPSKGYNLTVWNLSDYSSWTKNELSGGHWYNSVTDVAFSHSGNYLASCSKDDTVKIWNPATSALLATASLGADVLSVAWSPADTHIAAGLANGSIAKVNASDTNDIAWMGSAHTGRVNSVDWGVTGNEIVSGASDPRAKVWYSKGSPYYGAERLNLSGHVNSVYSVDWSANEQSVATAGGISAQYGLGENQIFCAVSVDGGVTFADPVLVSDSCSGNRLRPKTDMNSSGAVSVTWYDLRRGDQDVYFANSTLAGPFSKNTAVAYDSGEDVTPDVFLDDSGVSHVVWQYGTGAGIRYANSTDGFKARIMATTAQMPHIAGNPDGSSLWVTWRHQNQTTSVNYLKAAVSYNRGAGFADWLTMNYSSSFVGEHAVHVDRYNQTNFAWEVNESPNENMYHRTTVLADEWGPSVLSTTPADGDLEVSIFTPFTIRFSEPMDQDATEAAFSWTDGATTWHVGDCTGNQATWNSYGDTASFTPRIPLQYLKSGYIVSIGTGAKDLAGNAMASGVSFSFTTSADIDPPMIEHYPSQDNVSYDQTYSVLAVVTDQWGTVGSVELKYTGVDGANYSVEMAVTYADTYLAAIPAQMALGTLYYYIEAADAYGNTARSPTNYTNRSQLHSVDVVDDVKPEISHVQVMEAAVFWDIGIWAAVTDGIQLQNATLNYMSVGASVFVGLPMTANASGNTFEATIPAQTATGQVQYNITAMDASGNFNTTGTLSIQVMDLTAPLINSVTAEYLDNQTKVRVRANVTDDVHVETVNLYFKAVGGNQWVNRSMTAIGGDIFEFTIPAQSRSGTIYYYVNATDRDGNSASTLAEQDQFEIEVVGIGQDYTMYYILGTVLAVMLLVLGYLIVRKYGGGKPAGPEAESAPEEDEAAEAVDEP